MGLLGKVLEKTIENAVINGNAEKLLDIVNQKISHAVGMKTEEEILKDNQDNYKLVIIQKSSNIDFFFGDVDWRDFYFVLDKNEEQHFVIKGNLVMGKHYFSVFDNNKKELGKIKKKLITIPLPFQKEARECDIIIDGKMFSTMRTYVDVFLGERYIDFSADMWEIKNDNSRYKFNIYFKRNQIGNVHKVISSYKDKYDDKYVLEFQNKEYELECLMIAIAIDALFFAE